jgi:hypothetical protein
MLGCVEGGGHRGLQSATGLRQPRDLNSGIAWAASVARSNQRLQLVVTDWMQQHDAGCERVIRHALFLHDNGGAPAGTLPPCRTVSA